MDYELTTVNDDTSLCSNLYVHNDQDMVDTNGDDLDVFENDGQNDNNCEVTVADSVNESPGGTKYFTPAVNNDIIPRSHNHVLFDGNEMSLSRARRGLIYEDYRNVYHASCTKIGIAKSHRMKNALKGGNGISGGTVRDFQNVKRDMVTFIGNKDAQMLINTMVSRQKVCPEFFFEFRCNEKEVLDVFWADEIMKMNYREFGDSISFDATYRTNLHAMVFVPFIGIDNHKRSVVVGAALTSGETAEDYTWVLKAFMKAHGREPKFVITDQCPAMKKAIPAVFPGSVHRLCMWHIIKNVKSRISARLAKETNFIPDFKKLSFDMAIESQRRSHCVEEVKTKTTVPRMVSPRKLEAHASKVYTRTIFFEFQKELTKSVWYCGVEDIEKVDDKKIYTITRKTKDSVVKAKYKVVKEAVDGSLSCSCNKFVRDGILCRHSLKVMINDGCDKIPEMYIMRRWRRDLIPAQWMSARVKYGEIDVEKERLMGSAFVMVERIMDRVRNDKSLLTSFVALLTSWNDDLDDELPRKSAMERKKDTIQEILGVSVPDDPNYVAPSGIKNKGSGTRHRLKGAREKAVEEARKPKRLCRTCKDFVQHDSRNCPQRGI
ncbi:hypothetical protein OSB04_011045 [Centaurea solstitialis]|uniref:SWIM-type domain-containing protein n=1 Tax=Centaurea solstitialis TaxID=347529 RepID=A0AA38WPT1_9ASTR|nr:hypothetical protein OSB04_011045 [Centaurea solstitialis]